MTVACRPLNLYRLSIGLPPTGRTLDIGEQECHHPGGGLGGHGISSAHCMWPSKPKSLAIFR